MNRPGVNCPGINCTGVNCPGVNCPDTILFTIPTPVSCDMSVDQDEAGDDHEVKENHKIRREC